MRKYLWLRDYIEALYREDQFKLKILGGHLGRPSVYCGNICIYNFNYMNFDSLEDAKGVFMDRVLPALKEVGEILRANGEWLEGKRGDKWFRITDAVSEAVELCAGNELLPRGVIVGLVFESRLLSKGLFDLTKTYFCGVMLPDVMLPDLMKAASAKERVGVLLNLPPYCNPCGYVGRIQPLLKTEVKGWVRRTVRATPRMFCPLYCYDSETDTNDCPYYLENLLAGDKSV